MDLLIYQQDMPESLPMKMRAIVYRYVFKEMIPPFVISLGFFSFIFLMTTILDITHLIVNFDVSPGSIILLLIYSMPFFLEFIIPMSVMMSVLLSFLRLSSDNEIVALKSGGISIYGLLPPVLFFCFIGFILTGLVAIIGLPHGRMAFKSLSYRIAASSLDAGIKEKTFNDSFKDIMLYVGRIDLKTRTYHDVFIEDSRAQNSSTVIAPRGKLFKDPDQFSFHLRLYNGTIHQVDPDRKTVQSVRFNTYDVNLDLPRTTALSKDRPKDEEEMSLAELADYLHRHAEKKDQQYYLTLMEYHKKFSLPSACFALGLIGVPLGLQSRSSKRSFGVGLGLIFFLLYYLLLSVGWVFGEAGSYPPLIGMWMPNIVTAGIAGLLIVRAAREREVSFNEMKNRVLEVIKKGR